MVPVGTQQRDQFPEYPTSGNEPPPIDDGTDDIDEPSGIGTPFDVIFPTFRGSRQTSRFAARASSMSTPHDQIPLEPPPMMPVATNTTAAP